MARSNTRAVPTPPSSYDLMGLRLQKIINSPASQLSKSALLERLPEDKDEDWERLVDELRETENVTVEHRGECYLALTWIVPSED